VVEAALDRLTRQQPRMAKRSSAQEHFMLMIGSWI